MFKRIFLFGLLATLFSCVAPVKKGVHISNSEKKAYVIVALKGNMNISEARYCYIMCSAWYSFGDEGQNGVHIFQKSVGSTFEINNLYSGLKVVAFNGKKIKISAPGVYYFGLIESVNGRMRYTPEPNPLILKQVKEKYGNDLANLKPIDFSWPE